MAYPKKHDSHWFTTSDMRAINLDWVTDVKVHYKDYVICGATISLGIQIGQDQVVQTLAGADAKRLLDLLV